MLGLSQADSAAFFAEVALGRARVEWAGWLQRKWQLDGNVLRFDKSNRSLEYTHHHPRCCMNDQAAFTEACSSDTGVRFRFGENRMNECQPHSIKALRTRVSASRRSIEMPRACPEHIKQH